MASFGSRQARTVGNSGPSGAGYIWGLSIFPSPPFLGERARVRGFHLRWRLQKIGDTMGFF